MIGIRAIVGPVQNDTRHNDKHFKSEQAVSWIQNTQLTYIHTHTYNLIIFTFTRNNSSVFFYLRNHGVSYLVYQTHLYERYRAATNVLMFELLRL